MRVDPKPLVPVTTSEPREPRAAAPAAAGAPDGAAIVELTPAGAAAASEPTSKAVTQRIAHIRQLLKQGQYPIDLDQLASRIVDDDAQRGGS